MPCFCAHRGVSALMPENSLAAFAAAVALSAAEIEFDIRLTGDQKLVTAHDSHLERISDGTGFVSDYTLEELKEFNIGETCGWVVPFATPEEIFSMFGGKVIMNIHLKEHGPEGYLMKELYQLICKYKIENSVYVAGSPDELEWMERIMPNIPRAAIQLPKDNFAIMDAVKKYGCSRVQFWKGMFDQRLVDEMHENQVICNMYHADDSAEMKQYLDMGIDVILTNRMDIARRHFKDTAKWNGEETK